MPITFAVVLQDRGAQGRGAAGEPGGGVADTRRTSSASEHLDQLCRNLDRTLPARCKTRSWRLWCGKPKTNLAAPNQTIRMTSGASHVGAGASRHAGGGRGLSAWRRAPAHGHAVGRRGAPAGAGSTFGELFRVTTFGESHGQVRGRPRSGPLFPFRPGRGVVSGGRSTRAAAATATLKEERPPRAGGGAPAPR